jgi:hypothetical protein
LGVALTTQTHLMHCYRRSIAIHLLTIWDVVVCFRVNFTFTVSYLTFNKRRILYKKLEFGDLLKQMNRIMKLY